MLSKPGRKVLMVSAAAAAVAVAMWLIWLQWVRPAAVREPLVLGIADALIAFPVLIAEEKGFFREEGLDVTLRRFPHGQPALDAQLRGEIEVATVAETPMVIKSFSTKGFVILASISHADRDNKVVAHPRSGIATVGDLRGRRVGVVAGTRTHFFLHLLLTDHGLGLRDIVEVPMAATETMQALTAGRVDAIAVFEPYASLAQAELRNAGLVFDGGGRNRLTYLYTARRDFAARRPDAAKRLLIATDKAIDWIASHRQEAITIVARHAGLDPGIIDSLWDDYRGELRLDQSLVVSLEEQARWAVQVGLVPPSPIPNYLEFIDVSALSAIKPEVVMRIR